MEPLSIFAAFTVAAAVIQEAVTAALDFDDRPKPRLRVRKCWVCCGTARYQGQVCPECRGSGLA